MVRQGLAAVPKPMRRAVEGDAVPGIVMVGETPRHEEDDQTVIFIDQEEQVTFVPQYHVVLLDDDDHSYDYVVEMLVKLFAHSSDTAFRMACEVDSRGRVIVDTTYKERADMKKDQIQNFGPDWRIPRCLGSMSAIVEPAE